jgi:hypothetical protein
VSRSVHRILDWRGALGKTGAVLAACFLTSAFAGADENWPQLLGPHANGISDETGLLDTWPANGPPLLWAKEVGTGYGAPSVLDQRVVLHHRLGDEEVVECFAAESGQSLWRYAYPSRFMDPYGYNNGPRCTPLLTSNLCYTFARKEN